ncbi:WD40 repeat-containing protein MSI4-like protein, partial [Tanacetum coccineum]
TDGSVPNTLVIANCEIVKPRVAAAEHISQFNEEARSPYVKKFKTIIHPGEVNRIRELPQNSNIVATHTDSPDVLIWDVESQPNRHAVLGATESRPDLILSGHQENAEFALDMCRNEPLVLSGGKDKTVVLWSIHDHISTLATQPGITKNVGSDDKPAESPVIQARGVFHGHEDTVEDVQFCPSSGQEFCSVGDDSCLILWDARTGSSPVVKVEKAHDADLHCVDWNPIDQNLILTGSADNTIRLFDRRNLTTNGIGSPIHIFENHTAAVLCVQWSPDKSSVFGSSAEDGILNVWDHNKIGESSGPASKTAQGLLFRHSGHRDKVVDFHWNAHDPWTIVSVSNDDESTGGGGTLQIWRMIDLIYRPEQEEFAEWDKVVDFTWNAHDPWTIVSVSNDDESTDGGGTLQSSSSSLSETAIGAQVLPLFHWIFCKFTKILAKLHTYQIFLLQFGGIMVDACKEQCRVLPWDPCSFLDGFVVFLVKHRIGVVTGSKVSSLIRHLFLLQIASMVAFKKTQTDGSVPNTLVIANYEIVKPRVAVAEHISQFNEEARSPYVKKFKTIIHPGESVGSDDKPAESPVIQARGVFHGHEDTVEDVQFCPSSGQEFCSVGDDSCLILWDARTGSSPVVKVEKAHDADLHCVDWNPIDENLILTGSADNTIRLFDRRNLTTKGIHISENHTACCSLCADKSSVFGSSADDGILNVWDHNKIGESSGPASKTAQGLLFRHSQVVDFHWNAHDSWTIVSVSNDDESTGGMGGDKGGAQGAIGKKRKKKHLWEGEKERLRNETLTLRLSVWGPQLEQATYKNRQRLYLSEQTDGSVPNTLVIANCEIVKPRVAAAEHISQFNEEARSPYVKKFKTIIHPGEVNRIRELPQNSNIVATHTDSPDVLIWDVESQPNRHAVLGATESRPDLILSGHQENAEFALDMCRSEPLVLSGDRSLLPVKDGE